MAKQNKRIHVEKYLPLTLHVTCAPIDAVNIESIEGVSRTWRDRMGDIYCVVIDPRYDEQEVVTEIESLNCPIELPIAFQER